MKYSYKIEIDDNNNVNEKEEKFIEVANEVKRNFSNAIQSVFVSYFERYKKQALYGKSYTQFYEYTKGANKLNTSIWTLAQSIRNLISHGNSIDYADTKQPLIRELNINRISLNTSYYSFSFDSSCNGKGVEDLFSPVELILLMIDMESQI